MIENSNDVDEILKIVNEAKDRNYDEIVLKMDLDRFLKNKYAEFYRQIDEAYEEGKSSSNFYD